MFQMMKYKLVNFWSENSEVQNLHGRSQISRFGAFQQLRHTILTVLSFSEVKNFNTIVFLVKIYVKKVSHLKSIQLGIRFSYDEVLRSKLRKKINFEKNFSRQTSFKWYFSDVIWCEKNFGTKLKDLRSRFHPQIREFCLKHGRFRPKIT